jgi:hypothetical protein
MAPRHQLISAKHLISRLRVLPDEIFQARKLVVEETRKLARLRARIADLESELLTQTDSPIDGKNKEIRDAQLHERLKVWDLPVADQEYLVGMTEALHGRLVDEFESLRHINFYLTAFGCSSEENEE